MARFYSESDRKETRNGKGGGKKGYTCKERKYK